MANITANTKISELLKEYPWLVDEAAKISDKAKLINTPVGKMLLKKATIADAADKTGISADVIIGKITELIQAHQ